MLTVSRRPDQPEQPGVAVYIVAIAWIYVALMMAITEPSVTAGVMTFIWYGLAPLALFLWLMGTNHRRRLRVRRDMAAQAEATKAERDSETEPQ